MRASELAGGVRDGSIDPVEHTEKVLEEIERIDKDYHYLNTICADRARKAASDLKKGGSKGRLAGIPLSIKDSIVVKGVESTGGSAILKGYVPVFNATCVERGEKEGAIVIGKTSQDEFGFGAFAVNVGKGFRIPKNPIDPTRATGGSSGGAAGLAKKASFPTISYGESTGGSIVNPASFCDVFGLCPTYGRVSRYGLIDYGNSLDKVGPISRYLSDVALGLEVMAGHDAKDSTSADAPVEEFSSSIGKDLRGLRIGVIKESFGEGTEEDVKDAVWTGIKRLEGEGARYEEVNTPLAFEFGIPAYYIIGTSEASTNLAKYCGMRYGVQEETADGFNEYFTRIRSENLGDEAKRRVMLGTFARMSGVRDAYYLKAAKVRTKIIEEYKSLFKRFDILVSPTVPYKPPTFDEIGRLTPLQHYMADVMTVSPNLAGLPHLNIPAGMKKGLPVGMMAIADHWKESELFRAGAPFERP